MTTAGHEVKLPHASEWTPLEVEEFEDYIGQPMAALADYGDDNPPPMKVHNALLLLAVRRAFPGTSREEALGGMFSLERRTAAAALEDAPEDPTRGVDMSDASQLGVTF